MAGAMTLIGDRLAHILAVTLSPTSVEGFANLLPSCIAYMHGIKRLYMGANTSLSTAIDINVGAATVVITNGGGQTTGLEVWVKAGHTQVGDY